MFSRIFTISLLLSLVFQSFTYFFNQPVFSNNIMFDTADYLKFTYGELNKKKWNALIPGVLLGHATFIRLLYYVCFQKKSIVAIGTVIFFWILLHFFGLYYIPMHCPFGLCSYVDPMKESSYIPLGKLQKSRFISFIASADNQIMLDVPFPLFNKKVLGYSRSRSRNMVNNVKYINSIVANLKKISKGQLSDFIFDSQFEQELVKKSAKSLIGYVTAGDCTQKSYDGRHLSVNAVGVYEHYYNNNPEDGGLLHTSTYECMGNHDYIQEFSYSKRGVSYTSKPDLLYYSNPTRNMIVRRNKNRKYIVNSDQFGNYSCMFGVLRVIFLNVWPMEESKKLYTGVPVNSLKYLKEDVKKKKKNIPWIIVTHFVLNNRWDNDNPMKKFEEIYLPYAHNFYGFLYGHVHQPYVVKKNKGTRKGENRYGISYLLPSPAVVGASMDNPECSWDHQLTLFVFDQVKHKLYCLGIEQNKVKLMTSETLPTDPEQIRCYQCNPEEQKRDISVSRCLYA